MDDAELKGNYAAAFGQLCAEDQYRLGDLRFVPDVVLDLGANVGCFTTMARFRYPRARVVAVEPDPQNWECLARLTKHLPEVTCINKAVATGQLWRWPCERKAPYYGMVERYFTLGQIGATNQAELERQGCKPADIPTVTLEELVAKHVRPRDRLLMKVDIEGGEQCFFTHGPSWKSLRRADHLAMELHFRTYGTGTEHETNRNDICYLLLTMTDTHDCVLDVHNYFFWATRRDMGG